MGVILGYLLGNIPFAYLVARQKGLDIRDEGSGNQGAMNIARQLGWGYGLLVLLLDTAKGALAVIVAAYFGVSPYSAAAAAVLGHTFPLWLGGGGGKGLATALGAVLCLKLWWAVPAFVIGWLLVYPWRRQSDLANLVGSIGLAIYASQLLNPDPKLWLSVIALIILVKHWLVMRRVRQA